MQSEVPRLVQQAGGTSILYKNINLYGKGSPEETALRRARTYHLQDHTLYLLAAPLLWYGVPEILERLPDSSFLIAIEHDPLLAGISLDYIPGDLAGKQSIVFLHPADKDSLYKSLQDAGIQNFRRVHLLTLNGGYRVHHQEYARLHALLEEEVQQFWHNKYTIMHMLPLWVKNIFFNLSRFSSLKENSRIRMTLPSVFKPVVVAGAGPSLELTIPFLKTERDNFFLLAVDTAYTPLLNFGVFPDAVIVQEAQFFNLYDFINSPDINVPLIADISSYPGVFQLSGGIIHLFITRYMQSKLFSRLESYDLLPEMLPPMGSVGNTAVDIALRITRGPVFITGIDFSFYAGKTHSRACPQHLRMLQETTRTSTLLDFGMSTGTGVQPADPNRKLLLTTTTLERYARNFSRIFSDIERLFHLQPVGLPLSIPSVNRDEAVKIMRTWYGSRSQPAVDETAADSGTERRQLESRLTEHFFISEIEMLRRIYYLGREYLQGVSSENTRTELISLVNQCDYLFSSFPETGFQIEGPDPVMLKRILISTGHYLHLLKNAQTISSG